MSSYGERSRTAFVFAGGGSFGAIHVGMLHSLASRGIGMSQALGVGIAIQALETLVSVTAGSLGGLYLAWPGEAVRRWALRLATVGVATAIAAGLGVAVINLF